MRFLQNNLLALRGIFGVAAAVAAVTAVALAGCVKDPIEGGGNSLPDYPRIDLALALDLPQMVAANPFDSAASDASDAVTRAGDGAPEVSESEALTVVLGGSGAAAGRRSAAAVGAAAPAARSAASTGSPAILTPAAFAASGAAVSASAAVSAGAGASTRAGSTEANAVEQLIRGLWIVQFDGTASSSQLAVCEYYDGNEIVDGQLLVQVAEVAGDVRLYVVANVGETRFESLAPGTTLGAFEAQVCEIAPMDVTQAAADGLPMVGVYDGPVTVGSPLITLKRLVAKLLVTCTSQVPAGETFLPRSAQLLSLTTGTAYAAKSVPAGTSGLYPDAAQAANFVDAPAQALAEGVTSVWYIPENLRGVIAGITSATDKTAARAPQRSTAVELAVYYVKNQQFYDAIYRIYLGQNLTSDFNLVRNHIYTLSVSINGINTGDSRVEAPEIRDLSANGTANCYMADKAGTSFRFDATKMGNDATTPAFVAPSGGVSADAITPKALDPASVRVLWETGTERGSQVPFVELVDGTLLFTTAGVRSENPTEGNALIGVFDSGGVLCWSWHIWSTKYDPEVDYDSYSTGYDVMQFNLGADATAEEGEVGLFGLYYQWGRKDPFIGPKTTSSTGGDYASTVNDDAFPWNHSDPATNADPDPVAYSIQHPTNYLTGRDDWATNSPETSRRDNLWGDPYPNSSYSSIGSKSIYDPCPAGWRVASRNTWTGFTYSGLNNISDPDEFNVSGGHNCGWLFYTGGWQTGALSFYPSGGSLLSSGVFGNIGIGGYYWKSNVSKLDALHAGSFYSGSTTLDSYAGTMRIRGNSIRCVRDGNPHGATSTAINLSANGSSNCYIVGKAGTTYKFNAKVMGNGATTAPFNITGTNTASAPAIQPKTLAPASAFVLWETGTVKGGIIKSVTVENGYVVFTTAGNAGAAATEGNAVIGVRDASGTLIWSWHIWSTGYDPNASYDTYTNFAGKQYQVMKYNLGANCSKGTSSVPEVFGLLYQWGRKDPFIGPKTINSAGTDYAATVNDSNYSWENEAAAATGDAQITYAIQNPTRFLYRATEPYDWIASAEGDRRDNLWGNPNSTTGTNTSKGAKSIYDPCPPGWRVAPQDTWTGFTKDGTNTAISTGNCYVDNYEGFKNGWNFYTSGTGSGPTTTFFPAAGYRLHTSGVFYNVGSIGYSWSSSPYSGSVIYAGILFLSSSGVDPQNYAHRAFGLSVRCCKE